MNKPNREKWEADEAHINELYGKAFINVQGKITERLEECRDAIRSLYGFYLNEGIDIEDLKDLGNALVAIEKILNSRKETK